MRAKKLAACVAMCVCLAAPAWASIWTAGDGNWDLDGNWDDGVPNGASAYIDNGSIVTLDSAVTDITTLGVSWFSKLNIENGAGLTAIGEASVASGGNDTGTVAQSGGVVSLGSNLIVGEAAGGIGSWTMTADGTLAVGADLTVGGAGHGTFELGDTSALTVGGNINIAASGGSGALTVTGGTLGQLAGGGDPAILADVDVGSAGTFAVEGSTSTINVASYAQAANAALDVVLDNGGPSTIYVDGNITLDGALNVSIADGAVVPDGIYDIIAATGTRTGTFATKSLPAGVNFKYVDGSAKAQLVVGTPPGAGTITNKVWEEVTTVTQIGMPAGMTSVVKAVKVNGPAMTVNGVDFESDDHIGLDYPAGGTNAGYDIAGNGYHAPAGWLVSWPNNVPDTDLDNGGCSTGPDPGWTNAWMKPVPTYTLNPNTDYVMEIYFGDHNGRNTEIVIEVGGTMDVIQAPSTPGCWRATFEFTTDANTDFQWHVGGDPNTPEFGLDHWGPSPSHTAIISAFALYEAGGAPEPVVPEPGGLSLVGLSLLAVRRRRR